MPEVVDESSISSSFSLTIAQQIKLRKPRNQSHQVPATVETDLTPQIPSIIQSTRCKSSISSLFLSNQTKKKPKGFAQSTFRGLGCTSAASHQVSVPAVIRASADWESKKVKKKKKNHLQHEKKPSNGNSSTLISNGTMKNDGGCVVMQDVWCGPGIGFSTDALVSGSVDCVVSAPRRNVSGRGKIDGEKMNINHRERSSSIFPRRATVNPESLSFLDQESTFLPEHPESDLFGGNNSRYYRHARHPSPDGLAEIVMFQNDLLMGGRLNSRDLFRDWRLDVDNMTYEQLLELGDRIGYVSTGLKEDEMHSVLNDKPLHLSSHVDKKCSICQEEYEENDEVGNLNCGHNFHIKCIKQWLKQKNTCPVCKATAMGRQ